MKYFVRRTSVGRNSKPCDGAYIDFYADQKLSMREGWFIDLTPDELVKFCEHYECVIVNFTVHGFAHKTPVLEIYDDYRE